MSAQAAPEPGDRATWGPISGVLFVVLLVASFFVVSTPNTNKSPDYILNWYSSNSHKNQLHISLLIGDIAVVFGLFWFGYLRDRFGRTAIGAQLSPVLLAGAVVFALGGLLFNGAEFAVADDPKKMLPATAQTLNFLTSDVGAAALVVGVSVVMWAAGFIIYKTGILPRWLAWAAFVIALVSLAGPLGFFAFIASGLWFLIVAVMMWRWEQNLPAAAAPAETAAVS